MLQIAVHREDVVALGVIEAGGERRGLTEVAPQFDDQNAAVDGRDLLEQLVGAVARSVVHKNELEAIANLLHDRLQAVIERSHVFFLVMKGDDNRILCHLTV